MVKFKGKTKLILLFIVILVLFSTNIYIKSSRDLTSNVDLDKASNLTNITTSNPNIPFNETNSNTCEIIHNVTYVEVYKTTKWIIPRDSVVLGNFSNVKLSFDAVVAEKIESLLNFRKLVLFVVNQTNYRLNSLGKLNSECFKYWANPLNILEVVETNKNNSSRLLYSIKFLIEPGQLQFEALVQKIIDKKLLYEKFELGKQNKITLVFSKISEADKLNGENCLNYTNIDQNNTTINKSDKSFLNNNCLCRNIDPDVLLNKTAEARKAWNTSDIELYSWPPNVPMYVSDYITFGRKELYIHTPNNTRARFCNPNLKMIIMISSAPTHFSFRQGIRETYGDRVLLQSLNVSMIFLFGKVNDAELQANLTKELTEFDDIVQADFMDSYHNLTLSHLSMYNWLYTFCEMKENSNDTKVNAIPKWILKADDDYLLNIDLALKIADSNPDIGSIGYPFSGTPPIRDSVQSMTKYYVPKYMYAPDLYVSYLSGVTYMIQTNWISKFLQGSLTIPIIHMDDAYVTGLVAYEIGLCAASFPTVSQNQLCQLRETVSDRAVGPDLFEKWKNLTLAESNCTNPFNGKFKVTSPEPTEHCLFKNRSFE